MKRIIITESQYKRLVSRPLNEEVSGEGDKVTDFNIELEGNNIRRWNDNDPEHVERIQKMLKSLNYDLGYYGPNGDGVDGIYGPFTEKAVKEFQENEMPNQPEQWDGIIGPITYEILKDGVKELSDEEGVEVDDLFNNDDVEVPDDVEEFEFNGEGFTHEIPTILHDLMYLISSKESKNHSYDSAYPSKIIDGLSEMSIEEATSVNGSSAVGRWQFIPEYMADRVQKVGLKMSDKFSDVNQDKMAMLLIKGWERLSCEEFAQKLAHIWAAVPVLYDQKGNKRQIKRGQSYYEGVQGNSAGIGANEFETAVRKTGCDGGVFEDNPEDEIVVDAGGDIEENNNLPDNFAKVPVGTNVFRSSQPSLSQLKYILNNYDIDTVIRMNAKESTNVSRKDEKKLVESMGKRYVFQNAHINEGGGHGKRGYEKGKGYVGSLNIVQPLLEQGNVLIHCTAGADRTGYQVARFMKDNGYCGNTDSENCRKSLWDYTIKYNSWEQYIPQGSAGYIRYMEAFYPYDDWKEEIG